MVKKIISLTISEDLVNQVDKGSKAMGMSRSEFVELLLQKGFHFAEDATDTVDEISRLQTELEKKLVNRSTDGGKEK